MHSGCSTIAVAFERHTFSDSGGDPQHAGVEGLGLASASEL